MTATTVQTRIAAVLSGVGRKDAAKRDGKGNYRLRLFASTLFFVAKPRACRLRTA
jgi:hypothetical protein